MIRVLIYSRWKNFYNTLNYFNFILTNEINHQELYHIVVSKNIVKKEDKYNDTEEK